MHEFTIASSIVESLLDLANKQGSNKVLLVHLKIGKLRALSTDQVDFSYHILAKGTALEGSKLIIEEQAGKLSCSKCDYQGEFNPGDDSSFHFVIPPMICPSCGSSLEIQGGDECMITSVRMAVPSARQERERSEN